MIACHTPHTHILCLTEHSLKEQLSNILVSLYLQCVALGLICCTIQALLSIPAPCCLSARVLLDLEGMYCHYVCISLMHVGN